MPPYVSGLDALRLNESDGRLRADGKDNDFEQPGTPAGGATMRLFKGEFCSSCLDIVESDGAGAGMMRFFESVAGFNAGTPAHVITSGGIGTRTALNVSGHYSGDGDQWQFLGPLPGGVANGGAMIQGRTDVDNCYFSRTSWRDPGGANVRHRDFVCIEDDPANIGVQSWYAFRWKLEGGKMSWSNMAPAQNTSPEAAGIWDFSLQQTSDQDLTLSRRFVALEGFRTLAPSGNEQYGMENASGSLRISHGTGNLQFGPWAGAPGSEAFVLRATLTGLGQLGLGTVDFGGGGLACIGMLNTDTVPTTNPAGGGVLYVTAGGLFYRGSGGTITPLAAA